MEMPSLQEKDYLKTIADGYYDIKEYSEKDAIEFLKEWIAQSDSSFEVINQFLLKLGVEI